MDRSFDKIINEFFESYDLQFGHVRDGKHNFSRNDTKKAYYSGALSICLDMEPLEFSLTKALEDAEYPNKISTTSILQAYRQISGRLEVQKQTNGNANIIQELEDRQKKVESIRFERKRVAEIVDNLPKKEKNELAGRVMKRIESKDWHFYFAKKLSAIKKNGPTPFLLGEMAWLHAKESEDFDFLKLVPKSIMDFGGGR